ncbi:hypothetical protein T484DRAFT_1857674 [Baffinella frigidus]|nr:hypothetical protein T484DRAFT_1857674 [Cryptophyta sp. CCMP2293]
MATIRPGFPGNLSGEQQAAVGDLGVRLASDMARPNGQYLVSMMGGTECFLCRLLRARGWDADEAQKLCGEILAYRLEQSLDTIVKRIVGEQPLQKWDDPNWHPEIKNDAVKKVAPFMPCGRHGFTATGQVVEIWRINQLRPTDILEKCTKEEISLWWHFHLESGMQSTLDGAAKYKHALQGQILVFDLHGFGVRHLHRSCISLLISLFGIGQSK